ncbi:Enhancer of yellow 2 transcription factor-like protein [Monoraphidium neglectum]|uniref:Transcription and mRNA export factor ENY2 n=1 Tax=Monoraphidium neglectum TaxID=145388 RepID=A0A0D2M7L8_9CHLO|nr:Enhancer of yellow 2 transcription factor-like protein [Monoraphidium neglectum]KIY99369.1 Enhancer of yellow 2 transcription factor-like protein [Monoraphidium neglectum]|eukprot:XP_013898389.1 Enhancer of yellow 2 transcription factor-like protein [Monoraphidium neglectum]
MSSRVKNDAKEEEASAAAREVSLEAKIRHELIRSGERERLKRLLRDKLTECGWRDDVKQRCREYIQQRGRDNVTADDVVRHVRPQGRAAVPDSVKADLLMQIKSFMVQL